MDTLLTLPIKTLVNNLKPNDTLVKIFEDLDEAVRLHETGKLRQDADILTLKMWHMVIMETLAGEGYDFEAKDFLG